ncbi:E3 ubiquitin-protein ligase RNF126-like isoform 1-T1 [Pholidichthys leucotaenia]
MASRQRYSAWQPCGRPISQRQVMRHEGVPTLEGIIQPVVDGIVQPTAMPDVRMRLRGRFHSSPVEYAWGPFEVGAVLAWVLNQIENVAPPPAYREMIKNLPTISITEEHVSAGLACPVCKEDYSVQDNVRQLPCSHFFHNDCIVPWLERRDTCPVCRTNVRRKNTATDLPESSRMDYSPSSSSPNSPRDESAAGHS